MHTIKQIKRSWMQTADSRGMLPFKRIIYKFICCKLNWHHKVVMLYHASHPLKMQ